MSSLFFSRVQVDCETLAVVAASLANHGVCPVTKQMVAQRENVISTLQLMFSWFGIDFLESRFFPNLHFLVIVVFTIIPGALHALSGFQPSLA